MEAKVGVREDQTRTDIIGLNLGIRPIWNWTLTIRRRVLEGNYTWCPHLGG